jgi:hypothetical protein
MKIKLILVTFILNVVILNAQSNNSKAISGSGDVVKTKTGSRGTDPEVKLAKRVNSANTESKVIQPPSKGAKSRGGYCDVVIDNWTSYYLDCYVDGYYEGYLSPWGSGRMSVGGGVTRAYAKAEFEDGSYSAWGPVSANCEYSTLTMTVFESYYNYSID